MGANALPDERRCHAWPRDGTARARLQSHRVMHIIGVNRSWCDEGIVCRQYTAVRVGQSPHRKHRKADNPKNTTHGHLAKREGIKCCRKSVFATSLRDVSTRARALKVSTAKVLRARVRYPVFFFYRRIAILYISQLYEFTKAERPLAEHCATYNRLVPVGALVRRNRFSDRQQSTSGDLRIAWAKRVVTRRLTTCQRETGPHKFPSQKFTRPNGAAA